MDELEVQSIEEVHDLFARALDVPEWYDRNLDALFDCLTDAHEPVTVRLLHRDELRGHLGRRGSALIRLLRRVSRETLTQHCWRDRGMIILIAGASHTGKTLLAQRLLEKYGYPYLSIGHLKMGLIRSGYTSLTPESSGRELTDYLWPVVREIIKTAIENRQNLIVEGCDIPFGWTRDFEEAYRVQIQYRDDSRTFAQCCRNLAERLGIRFADAGEWDIPTVHDGVHFTEQGHRAFAAGVLEVFR